MRISDVWLAGASQCVEEYPHTETYVNPYAEVFC